MSRTFSEVAHEVALRHVPASMIKSALESVGPKAEHRLAEFDTEHKLVLVTQFVRALRNVGVAQASRIEHELFDAVGASPTGKWSVAIKDAISFITIRNHVHLLATALGMPWSASMQVQSAISEMARFIGGRGGGRIAMEADPAGCLLFHIEATQHLGPITIDSPILPPWLVGVAKLATSFRSSDQGGGTRIELAIAVSQVMVA